MGFYSSASYLFGYFVFQFIFLDAVRSLDCSHYGRLEDKLHCGEDGYFVQYAQKYCNRFGSEGYYDAFDQKGQEFIDCTRKCLLLEMDSLLPSAKVDNPALTTMDCNNITYHAFNSHSTCYLKCNFCEVCKTNKWAFLQVYEFSDFLSFLALKQIYYVLAHCGITTCLF